MKWRVLPGSRWGTVRLQNVEHGQYLYRSGLDVPAVGGDTVWASMTAAHDALPAETRDLFEGVTCVHSASASYSPAQQDLHSGLSGMDIRTSESAEATRDRPLLCTHPETGRHCL